MPEDFKQRLGDEHRLPPPLYFWPPPPRRAEPSASAADAPPDRGGIATRLHAKDISAQVERERTKALNTVDDQPELRSRLVAIHASERLVRDRLRQGLPAHSVMVASVHRRMAKLTEEMAAANKTE